MGLRKFFRSKKKLPLEKTVKVGNYELIANYEHPIEEYLTQFPYYSRNFARIAKYIEAKYPVYQIIDVGANIGDSVALLRSAEVQQFVHLIEGDPTYTKLLAKNIPLFSNIKVYETFLGEENKEQNIAIDNTRGTAHINIGAGDQQIKIVKLDHLVAENKIENVKLLKTDTDGFDFKILRGAFNMIKNDQPVLFFEYDSVFLKQQNDDGLAIFEDFKGMGYNKIMYYDNFGKFLISTTLSDTNLLTQLFEYINKKESAFPYYDVVLFHENDLDLANEIIKEEMKFFS